MLIVVFVVVSSTVGVEVASERFNELSALTKVVLTTLLVVCSALEVDGFAVELSFVPRVVVVGVETTAVELCIAHLAVEVIDGVFVALPSLSPVSING